MYNNPYYNLYGMNNQMYGQGSQNFTQPNYSQIPTAQNVQNVQPVQNVPTIQQVNKNILPGKIVESADIVKSIEIPMDGSVFYFVLADGSGIVTKQLTNNGTCKTVIFKPISDEKEEVKAITLDDLKSSIDELKNKDNSDVLNLLEEIKKEIKKKGDK